MLPPGWQEVKSHDGGVYYWNTATNDVQWEKPDSGLHDGARESYGAADVFSASDLSASDSDWLVKNEVTLSKGCPPPLTTFEAANLPPSVMNEIRRAGFPGPSPIQAASWAAGLQGLDVVGIAKTGSGKTLGFLAPAFVRILRERKPIQAGPSTLVLAPTRELATQIQVRCHLIVSAPALRTPHHHVIGGVREVRPELRYLLVLCLRGCAEGRAAGGTAARRAHHHRHAGPAERLHRGRASAASAGLLRRDG